MSAAEDRAADQAARERAVDPTRSVILQAPAGSGKTTVLIERLLVLLAQAETPEEILAITFTRKAAAEMALRVAQVLQLQDDEASDPRTRRLAALAQAVRARSQARGWQLEANPGRLRIQTLDALNRALALQMPLAAHSGTLEVLQQAQPAYQRAARRTLLDAQADEGLRDDVQGLFERMENSFKRCEQLIADMLARRTHWLPYLVEGSDEALAQRVQESVAAVVGARLARARGLLPATLRQEGLAIGVGAAAYLEAKPAPPGPWQACRDLDASRAGLDPTLAQWQALATQALTKSGQWRKRLTVTEGFPKEDAALKQRATDWVAQLSQERGALDLLNEMLALPDPTLSADETQMLGVLARLLRLAVAELAVVFGELGRVDYPAIAAAARTALGSLDEPTDLTLRLDSQLRHILVDEFQDTSLEQVRLLTLLTAGWEAGDGRTLFVVGDPMQSIYGFREAEVGMFLGARSAGIGTVALEPLTLRRNFRSATQVVAWNNAVFAASFPELDDPRTSAVAYAPSVAARTEEITGSVHLHRVLPRDIAGEAQRIAQLVAPLRAADPAASIAVLVASRTHAGPIVAALEARQIPVAGVDLVSLQQLSIVRDLTALTQALDHLGDRTAWLALLRAPWCGLTLKDISALMGEAREVTVWERLNDAQALGALSPAARERVHRLQHTLTASLEEARQTYGSGREQLARRVESAWLRLGGPAAAAQALDLEHARAFFDALGAWCALPDWRGPQDLTMRLGQLYAAHAVHDAQAVQVMTIHRAKGLEFDHVILPGLGRKRRGNTRPLLQWLDLPRETQGSDLLMVAVPPAAAAGPTALGRYVSRLQDQRERHEATRLLYVAATRARRQLHLFGQIEDPTPEKPEPAPRAGTLLERLWSALRTQFPPQAPSGAAPAAVESPPATPLREVLSAEWQRDALRGLPDLQALPIASYEAPEVIAATALAERAVCEILRGAARRRELPPQHPGTLTERVAGRLQALGCEASDLEQATTEGVALLSACVADARLQWIFASLAAPGAHAEAPLSITGLFAGRLTSTRADLAFVDAKGTRWLIDIAPDPEASGGAVPSEAVLTAAFAVRLARHARLAQALEPDVAARAAVYVPARQLFFTLTDSEGALQGERPASGGIG